MKNKINYLVLSKDNFLLDSQLETFNKAGNYNFLGVISEFAEVFIFSENYKVDALFIFQNSDEKNDLLNDSLKLIKKSFPNMCICLFTNNTIRFNYVDYQFDLNESNIKIYSVLHRVKNMYGADASLGFFIPPHKITELFEALEIKTNYKGYDYLKTAIEMACRDKKIYLGNMSKLYKTIAEQYNVTQSSIERCIRLVITESSLNLDSKKLLNTKYNLLANTIEVSSNASFIRAVVNFLSESMYA